MTVHHDQLAVPAVSSPQHCVDGSGYGEFLHLEELLAATREVPDHPDGRFFVMAHQAYELWFELILHELTGARDDLWVDRVPDALYRLRRVAVVDRLLVQQLDTLGTISPGSFLSLRPHLGTASGFQSARFREVECLSGLRDRDHTEHPHLSSADRARLRRRLREPSLWDGFCTLLRRRGVTDPARLYCSGRPDQDLVEVAETMLDHDEAWAMWRMRHAIVVERIIGRRTGTGGSTGVDYLNSRRDDRFFPVLWQARGRL